MRNRIRALMLAGFALGAAAQAGEFVPEIKEPVIEQELFVAKGALSEGGFPVRYLDGYAITRSFALERLRYGNHNRSASYVERIQAVTADDVKEAASNYVRTENMQVILVGEQMDLLD